MKIALVSPYDYVHPGGVINHVLALSHEFTRMGHEVKVLAPTSDEVSDPNFIKMGRVFPISVPGTVLRISPSLRLASRINRVLEEEKFDIIHLHEPFMPMLCSAILKYADDFVNVGTFHACNGRPGYHFGRPISSWMLNNRNKKLYGRIAVSPAAYRYASRFVPGEFTQIPNGVSLERFNPSVRPVEEYMDGKINIVFVGRFEKRKGVKYLLHAYKHLKEEYDNIRLILVGPGDFEWPKYKQYVLLNRIHDVVFTGEVDNAELPRWYQTADIFCSPATGQESFGMVLIEAMALGKPIVATNNEGYASVVTDGKEGLLVKPRDTRMLAEALRKLILDKSLREEMGKHGIETVPQYDWTSVANRILSFYDTAIEKKKNNQWN